MALSTVQSLKVTLISCLSLSMRSFWRRRIFGVIRYLFIFDLKWSWPIEKVGKVHENHGCKNNADNDSNHYIHWVMTVVLDSGQGDVEGETERSKLQKGTENLQTSKKYFCPMLLHSSKIIEIFEMLCKKIKKYCSLTFCIPCFV